MAFLASDELQGREAGTASERIAAQYLASQLSQWGVRPFAIPAGPFRPDTMTYFQEFEGLKISVLAGSTISCIDSSGKTGARFEYGRDFVNFHQYVIDTSFQAEAVFVGYGITASEYGYDDYAGVDVRDRIVLALDGEPPSEEENFFSGEIPTFYSSALYYKRQRAKELGARALIVLAYEKLLTGWDTYLSFFKASHVAFADGSNPQGGLPFFYAREEFFKELLWQGGLSYDVILERMKEGARPTAAPLTRLSLAWSIHTKRNGARSMNVVGVIEGRDPNLKDEYVGLSAHFDHVGTNEKGEIFNGADDNASGTAVVLEVARALALSRGNRRSVLILFHGAEEKGLMGSDYFTAESTINPLDLDRIVSVINIDMVGRESPDSLFVIGAGRLSSELQAITESVNRTLGLFTFDYTYDDESDPNRYYYRSDHYNYARKGIPIVFFFDGMKTDYHKPTDDVEWIRFEKTKKVARLVYGITREIANRDRRLQVDRGEQP